MSTAEENTEKESGRDVLIAEEKTEKIRVFSAVLALLCCVASLYMRQTPTAIFCFGVFLVLNLNESPPFLEKHGVKIFTVISALIVCLGVVVRIFMYAKCRSLWLDEAMLAENIVARNWTELLATPLINGQSAPALYVVAVKAICSVFGYSEFSLRLFSFVSFIGLLVCEWLLLKKSLKADNVKTAFVLIITAFVPSFVYYSNELKPYMGDAFFVVLALLLYAFYTQNKISLVTLTVFYVLILGFCTPSAFFIGGILTAEFSAAAFARDKKHVLYVSISGLSIAALFGLYYYWWLSPQAVVMSGFWKSSDKSQYDAFFIVFVILLYLLYRLRSRKRPLFIILTLSYALISVFCPPAVFFIGGISAGELFAAAFARNKKRLISILVSMLSVAAVFGLYYGLRRSFVSEALNGFWGNPRGKTELTTAIMNIFIAFEKPSRLIWALVPFALLGVYSLIKQKSKVAWSVVLSMFFVCLASSIGKWPLSGRLWLFLPAVVAVFSSVGFDLISKGGDIVLRKTVFCLFSAITVSYIWYCLKDCLDVPDGMVSSTVGYVEIDGRLCHRNMLVHTQEVNPLIRYVKEHIEKDEKLYVYPQARYTLMFKNGYNSYRIGQTDVDNIIYGVNCEEWNEDKLGAELDAVIKARKAYILFQHYWRGIIPGITVLQKYGKVGAIIVNYDTPLFYFEAYE